jgi:hypothetical protein
VVTAQGTPYTASCRIRFKLAKIFPANPLSDLIWFVDLVWNSNGTETLHSLIHQFCGDVDSFPCHRKLVTIRKRRLICTLTSAWSMLLNRDGHFCILLCNDTIIWYATKLRVLLSLHDLSSEPKRKYTEILLLPFSTTLKAVHELKSATNHPSPSNNNS